MIDITPINGLLSRLQRRNVKAGILCYLELELLKTVHNQYGGAGEKFSFKIVIDFCVAGN